MTTDQRSKLDRLARCTMMPGGWNKRFVRDLGSKPDGYELSRKQAAVLDRLVHAYRRQLAATA